MTFDQIPIARSAMLVRRPVAEVYQAFVDPALTTKFWFTKSTGRLNENAHVTWTWEMFNLSTEVLVKTIEPNVRILIEWGDPRSTVEWTFTPRPDDTTFVHVVNSGFTGNGDAIIQQALGSTEGFTFVLSSCKAYLEHHLQLDLVADRFPDGIPHAET